MSINFYSQLKKNLQGELRENFDYIKINNEIINCGPATQKTLLAKTAANNNLTGFEFLYCIPGTIAGGIVMNSGCYGSDISKIVLSISVIDMNGEIKIINNKDINFSYRKSSLTKNQIITNIEMKGSFLKKEKVIEIMRNLKNKKDFEQPQKIKTGGSTFKNPRDSDKKAWELIKESGCADLRVGGIKLSKLHCNFLENLDGATSEDAENLIENIKQQVFKKTNINLELELEVVGKK